MRCPSTTRQYSAWSESLQELGQDIVGTFESEGQDIVVSPDFPNFPTLQKCQVSKRDSNHRSLDREISPLPLGYGSIVDKEK